ncbi:hypothetical protein M8J77_010755 [Diaphorina citri]|nr:hypothetical protein M8J77_010755 [Diaphorina citri]
MNSQEYISSAFTHMRHRAERDFLESTELNVTYLLRGDHFINGEATVECSATVAKMPRGSAIIKLSSESDPVPEKDYCPVLSPPPPVLSSPSKLSPPV